MKKKFNDIAIYLMFMVGALLTFSLIFGGGAKKPMKYYQIIDFFRNDQVVGYDLRLGTGDLALLVEEDSEKTDKISFALPDNELIFKNPALALTQTKQLIKGLCQLPVSEIYLDPKTGKLNVNRVIKRAVYRKINYKLPNVELFLFDTRDYVKEHDQNHPDKLMQVDYKRTTASVGLFFRFLLDSILPTIILIIGWIFISKYISGGSMHDIGGFKSKSLKYAGKGPKVTFEDVAALTEEKAELQDVVEFLKSPDKFEEIGARVPAGILMVGPPGTGKTLLARALAGEADAPFFLISGSAFEEVFVGVGASRVRELFEQAKKSAPCIIFIDEIDAIGRRRLSSSGGGDERNQTLNQLLVEMDGFSSKTGIVVIAATNMAENLDKALMRPGRFDRQVYVGYPDIKGREEILKVHARSKAIAPDVDFETVAKATTGFTGADLAGLLNEAALIAVKDGKKAIRAKDIDTAAIKVVVGTEKKSKVVTEKNKKSTAYHESGHAICAYYCKNYDDVNMVSIVPTGPAGGFTLSMPKEDDMYRTDKAMFESIVVSMGGRAAEKLMLDEVSTGASADMRSATLGAREMVTVYGFSEELGNVVYDNSVLGIGGYLDPLSHSEEVRAKIDSQIKKIIDKAYEKAVEILTSHKNKLEELAEYLIANERIDAAGFAQMMEA